MVRSTRTPAACVLAAAAIGCSPASIGSYPDTDETKLPDRNGSPSTDGGSGIASTFTLTVTLSGAGSGTIASTPPGVTCAGTTCSGSFVSGTAVTLTPTPSPASIFGQWGGQ